MPRRILVLTGSTNHFVGFVMLRHNYMKCLVGGIESSFTLDNLASLWCQTVDALFNQHLTTMIEDSLILSFIPLWYQIYALYKQHVFGLFGCICQVVLFDIGCPYPGFMSSFFLFLNIILSHKYFLISSFQFCKLKWLELNLWSVCGLKCLDFLKDQ